MRRGFILRKVETFKKSKQQTSKLKSTVVFVVLHLLFSFIAPFFLFFIVLNFLFVILTFYFVITVRPLV